MLCLFKMNTSQVYTDKSFGIMLHTQSIVSNFHIIIMYNLQVHLWRLMYTTYEIKGITSYLVAKKVAQCKPLKSTVHFQIIFFSIQIQLFLTLNVTLDRLIYIYYIIHTFSFHLTFSFITDALFLEKQYLGLSSTRVTFHRVIQYKSHNILA